MANLFLGVYYNLSIWYKLTDKTRYGAYISLIGVLITLSLNFYWIPRIGYNGSAWATFACYGSMMLISFFWGRKFYPVPYNIRRILFYLLLSVAIYFFSLEIRVDSLPIRLSINTTLLLGYLCIIFLLELNNLFPQKSH